MGVLLQKHDNCNLITFDRLPIVDMVTKSIIRMLQFLYYIEFKIRNGKYIYGQMAKHFNNVLFSHLQKCLVVLDLV